MTSTTTSAPPVDTTPAASPPSRRPPAPTAVAQRAAGWAAVAIAATYVVGLVVFGAWLGPAGYADGSPAEQVDVLLRHGGALLAVDTLLYLVGGVALAVLALGLHGRLGDAPELVRRLGTALGLLWSGLLVASGLVAVVGQRAVVELHATEPDRATTAWVAVRAVHDALGGGIELVGGLWVALVAVAGLRTGALPRGATRLGLVVATAGVLTVVPALEPLTAAFGLGMVVWFVWTGTALLRRPIARHL